MPCEKKTLSVAVLCVPSVVLCGLCVEAVKRGLNAEGAETCRETAEKDGFLKEDSSVVVLCVLSVVLCGLCVEAFGEGLDATGRGGGFSGDGLLKMTIPAVYCFVLEIRAGPA